MTQTTYHPDTPRALRGVLERFREMHPPMRLRITYDNGETVEGFVERTTGLIKVPTIAPYLRSRTAYEIATHRIVLIEYANRRHGGVLYKDPHTRNKS